MLCLMELNAPNNQRMLFKDVSHLYALLSHLPSPPDENSIGIKWETERSILFCIYLFRTPGLCASLLLMMSGKDWRVPPTSFAPIRKLLLKHYGSFFRAFIAVTGRRLCNLP
ncbi:hypothetical protein TNCT_53091 [Trichonephila clavata]|uniref:Uncharacterized protein n=1 Tax=Trichonephila clavata TaxID=2740835 RepID=A0A8X6HUI8_TRICU|nr:hypothetical protein TNCT_53091 [Trichonephila clavata]